MSVFSDILMRLRRYRTAAGKVLTINQRNLFYIYPGNRRRDFPLADNKLLTKELMQRAGVPVPETYRVFRYFFDLRDLRGALGGLSEFVVKPARGRAGGGILVITGRAGTDWRAVGGGRYSVQDLRKHLSDIIFGIYSFDTTDQVIIEQRLSAHPVLAAISAQGLPDVRVIMHQGQPIMAMIRLPTETSGGRANLHQGAVGVGIDLDRGVTTHAYHLNAAIFRHPDTGAKLTGVQLPHWDQVLRYSIEAARCVPLQYVGVDMAVTEAGAMLLEINARPGLAIQNANQDGLRQRLESAALASQNTVG